MIVVKEAADTPNIGSPTARDEPRFVEIADEVKESGLRVEDLEYLLRHRFDESGKYRPNHEGTLALLKTLAEGASASMARSRGRPWL